MSLPAIEHIEKDGFRLRGLHVSRIDAFSDVVFGFALTLLVVSLEVPKTYAELHESLRGFFPFAISFLFLMMVWFAHYKFFRRFGLHDLPTIVINGVLLFVVLFYVYPLKFLFTVITYQLMGGTSAFFDTYHQLVELMVLYGVGFSAIYFLIAALYWNGWRQGKYLQLNPLETMLARSYIFENAGVATVGLLSCLIALLLPERLAGLAGYAYILIGVLKTISRVRTGRKIVKLRALEGLPKTDPLTLEAP